MKINPDKIISSPAPLTRKDLDAMRCGTPGCTCESEYIVLTQACHPEAGTQATYYKQAGMLQITCLDCEALIAEVVVADQNRARLQ
jgi:hypothetical protein